MIVEIIIGVLFIGLGFLVRKYPVLLAGYNTMTKEQKANVDIEGLSKHMCCWFVCIGACILVLSFVLYLFNLDSYMAFVPIAAIFFILPVSIVSAQKYDHNPKKKGANTALVMAVLCVAILAYLFVSVSPAKVEVTEQKVSISGISKTEIPISDIKNVKIAASIPRIKMRTNGFALGNVRKGMFNLDSLGKTRLYLHTTSGPYLIIEDYNGLNTIFSYRDSSQVKTIYDQIVSAQMRGYIVNVGDMVPSLTLTLLDGTTITTDELRGKVVMLQFTASWCSVCRKEMPFIESEIWLKLKDNPDFALYGIDLKETPQQIKDFAAAIPVTYPITLDPDGKLFDLFCTKDAGVTRNIILDREGRIIKLTRLYKEDEFASMVAIINEELGK